jgi:hypothetical protein
MACYHHDHYRRSVLAGCCASYFAYPAHYSYVDDSPRAGFVLLVPMRDLLFRG